MSISRLRIASIVPCRTTRRPPSTTATRSRILATRTPQSRPTPSASAFREVLERWYGEHVEWVFPGFRYNDARSFIKQGLQDVSLSRVRISWGVEGPWQPEQVFYVWVDALLNYYTALTYARPGED